MIPKEKEELVINGLYSMKIGKTIGEAVGMV